jgi:hypothetical protein
LTLGPRGLTELNLAFIASIVFSLTFPRAMALRRPGLKPPLESIPTSESWNPPRELAIDLGHWL